MMNVTDKDIERFYNSRGWKMLRQTKLNNNPLCEICIINTPSRIETAKQVHHAVNLRQGWAQRYDLKLLFSLCDACHSQVTQEEKQEAGHEYDEALRKAGG